MAKVPSLTSPKIKKLAAKALKSPSMLTTEETRALGASVVSSYELPAEVPAIPVKKTVAKKSAKRS